MHTQLAQTTRQNSVSCRDLYFRTKCQEIYLYSVCVPPTQVHALASVMVGISFEPAHAPQMWIICATLMKSKGR